MRAHILHWLTPPILGFIPKKYIERPQLGTTELSQLGRIGPEHECCDDARQVAARFRGRVLKLPMCFNECSRIEQFAMNLHVIVPMRRVPLQFIRFIVKECCICQIRNSFSHDGNERPMIEPLDSVVLTTRILCAAMKQH